MNRVVIIGNGFDLAHGLKTSYAEFISRYWQNTAQKLASCNLLRYEDEFIICGYNNITPELRLRSQGLALDLFDDILYTPVKSRRDIEEHIKAHSSRVTLRAKSTFFDNINNSVETKNWVDIENEYYSLLKSIEENGLSQGACELNNELEKIKIALIEYLHSINAQISENMMISSILEQIFAPFNECDIATKSLTSLSSIFRQNSKSFTPNSILLLNFNYTNTAALYTKGSQNISINHIHGSLDNPESIIFGYGDEIDDGYKKIVNLNDNNFLSNIKTFKYLERDNYRKLLQTLDSMPFQVYIMGHSCGNSDRTLLHTIFEHPNCFSIKPYYHLREDGSDNYNDIVQNISRNFSDMVLMRDRVVNKLFCKPLVF